MSHDIQAEPVETWLYWYGRTEKMCTYWPTYNSHQQKETSKIN